MSEPTMGNGDHETPGVVRQRPPTRKDLRTASVAIMSAGIPMAIIGTRFFLHQNEGELATQDMNAAFMFWFGAALVIIVGAMMRVKASSLQ